ncbi:MAG: hypothetical protein VB876_12980 [Pirellulales bacterium]
MGTEIKMIKDEVTNQRGQPRAIGTVVESAEQLSGMDQLIRQIKHAIWRETNGRVHNLAVMITGTHIVLQGFCSTYHAYQLAQHAAMQLADDLGVENQIEVL